MSARLFGFVSFIIFILVLLLRDRSSHSITVHTPAEPVELGTNISSRPYYTAGPIRQATVPTPSLQELFTRKKIDNFIFNHYNHYKLQFTFIDLGYASNFMFGFFSEEYPYFKITQKIGFNLNEPMLDGSLNLDIRKKSFNLTVRQYIDQDTQQTITTFNLSFVRKQSNVNANLVHILRNKQCFTAVRKHNIISHKCFGGIGSGKVKIERIIRQEQIAKKQSNMLNLALNITRTVYDGLRGSGYHWRWVWGLMSGFSKLEFYRLNHTIPKQHWLGLNIGHIFDEGQDFAFLSGKIIPIEGLKYKIDQKVKVGTNITFTATKPRLRANFTVLKKVHEYEDMGIIKLDMVKLLGDWSGQIEDEEQGKDFGFYEISGMLESCDSLF